MPVASVAAAGPLEPAVGAPGRVWRASAPAFAPAESASAQWRAVGRLDCSLADSEPIYIQQHQQQRYLPVLLL